MLRRILRGERIEVVAGEHAGRRGVLVRKDPVAVGGRVVNHRYFVRLDDEADEVVFSRTQLALA